MMTWNKFNWIDLFQKQPPELFCEKGVLTNFAYISEKHLCWSLTLIKLQACGPTTLLKRGSNTGVFPGTSVNNCFYYLFGNHEKWQLCLQLKFRDVRNIGISEY